MSLNSVTATKVSTVPSIMLKNVEDIRIKDCRPVGDVQIAREVEKKL